MIVLCCSKLEALRIFNEFVKYSKGIPDFKVALFANEKPLPCEVNRLLIVPKVIVCTISRFFRVFNVIPINVSYLWIENLEKILYKYSPSKVKHNQIHQIYSILEKNDNFSAIWRRKNIKIVYITDESEDITTKISVLRLLEDPITYTFTEKDMEFNKPTRKIDTLKCKNIFKTLAWVLSENPGFIGKVVRVSTNNSSEKVAKIIKSLKIQGKIQTDIEIATEMIDSSNIDVWVTLEPQSTESFQGLLSFLPLSCRIISIQSS